MTVVQDITVTTAEETERVAAELARSLRPGDVVALDGELGSGKTSFVRGLAGGLGCEGIVNSPTFVRNAAIAARCSGVGEPASSMASSSSEDSLSATRMRLDWYQA